MEVVYVEQKRQTNHSQQQNSSDNDECTQEVFHTTLECIAKVNTGVDETR
jgi:hypothetical protein